MPRGPKLDIPGALRHVMVRGIDRQDIFLSNADRNGRIGADEARQVTASIQAERFERGQAGRAGDDQKRGGI